VDGGVDVLLDASIAHRASTVEDSAFFRKLINLPMKNKVEVASFTLEPEMFMPLLGETGERGVALQLYAAEAAHPHAPGFFRADPPIIVTVQVPSLRFSLHEDKENTGVITWENPMKDELQNCKLRLNSNDANVGNIQAYAALRHSFKLAHPPSSTSTGLQALLRCSNFMAVHGYAIHTADGMQNTEQNKTRMLEDRFVTTNEEDEFELTPNGVRMIQTAELRMFQTENSPNREGSEDDDFEEWNLTDQLPVEDYFEEDAAAEDYSKEDAKGSKTEVLNPDPDPDPEDIEQEA